MENCLFCSIAAKQIPAEIIYENDAAAAFLDIHPRAPGHTMVIPKTHAETILDVTAAGPLFEAVQAVTGMLEKALSPDGFTIGINHGEHAGQAVKHLHVHIIPRFADDHGTSIHAVVDNPPSESIGEIANKITNQTNN